MNDAEGSWGTIQQIRAGSATENGLGHGTAGNWGTMCLLAALLVPGRAAGGMDGKDGAMHVWRSEMLVGSCSVKLKLQEVVAGLGGVFLDRTVSLLPPCFKYVCI